MRQTDKEKGDRSAPPPDFEAFLHGLADIAGAAILPHFRSGHEIENKDEAGFDPVTVADRAAEQAMRDAIAAAFPDDGIVGEEFGVTEGNSDREWIIDPIDGTRSFIAGLPVWGVLIGLLEDGEPAFGMMAQPFTGERYWGDGSAAHYAGPGGTRTIRTRPCPSIEEAVLFTTSPHDFGDGEVVAYRRVEDQAKLARYGTDCYAYCMLAAGYVDVVIEAGLKPFDIMPLIPIIEGAGGKVTDWNGAPPPDTGQIVATGDPTLHDRVLASLRG